MLKKIVYPKLEVNDGSIEVSGYQSVDEFIHFEYENEANACIEEFMQILSCCEIVKKKSISNKVQAGVKLHHLADLMLMAENQKQLDEAYVKIKKMLNEYSIRLNVDNRFYFESYIRRERNNAIMYEIGNEDTGFELPSGQNIDNIEKSFLNSRNGRDLIMQEYIETAYKHLSAKFTLKNDIELLIKKDRKSLKQKETERSSKKDNTEVNNVPNGILNNEELKEVEVQLEKYQGYYNHINNLLNINRTNLERCFTRLDKIEAWIDKGAKIITDDDFDSWLWVFPSSTDKTRKDSDGSLVKLISISEAKRKVQTKINKLENEIKRLEGVLEQHKKKVDELSFTRDSIIKQKDEEKERQTETKFFGMEKFRKTMSKLIGKEDIENNLDSVNYEGRKK